MLPQIGEPSFKRVSPKSRNNEISVTEMFMPSCSWQDLDLPHVNLAQWDLCHIEVT